MGIRICLSKRVNPSVEKVLEQDITAMQYKRKKMYSQLVIGPVKIGK